MLDLLACVAVFNKQLDIGKQSIPSEIGFNTMSYFCDPEMAAERCTMKLMRNGLNERVVTVKPYAPFIE